MRDKGRDDEMNDESLMRVKKGMVDEICITSNSDYAIGIYQLWKQLWEDAHVSIKTYRLESSIPCAKH